jgi:hypothetical protein
MAVQTNRQFDNMHNLCWVNKILADHPSRGALLLLSVSDRGTSYKRPQPNRAVKEQKKKKLKTESSYRNLITLTYGLRVQNKRFFVEQRAWV